MESKQNTANAGVGTMSSNRTSMESKLWGTERLTDGMGGSSNRTSMESKLDLGVALLSAFKLLIEPVWNRNVSRLSIAS